MSVEVVLVEGPLVPATLLGGMVSPQFGGVDVFIGVVRDANRQKPVRALEYDCHPQLARTVLEQIGRETLDRWGPGKLLLAHGYGKIDVGQASVVLAAATPHRDEAFAACRYMIEEIKRRAPVWKRELYADGQHVWLPGTPLPEARMR